MTEAISGILTKSIKKRMDSIDKILSKSSEDFQQEDFHALRVDIKKLRAHTRLLEFCSKKFDRDAFIKPYKKVFAYTGIIREIQIELEIIQKLEAESESEKYIKRLNKKLLKCLADFKPEKFRKKIKKRTDEIEPFLCLNENFDQKKPDVYFEKSWKKIEEIIRKKTPRKEQLHDLRKYLKTFFYNLKIFEPENNIHDDITKYMDYLGQWHDYDIMLERISKAVKKDKKLELEILQDKLLKEERKLYQKIKLINQLPQYRFNLPEGTQ